MGRSAHAALGEGHTPHLSVRHVLVSCSHLSSERQKFVGSRSVVSRDVLGDDSILMPEVFRFLQIV